MNQQVPRALITGITGQDGLYLGEFLAAKGYEVFGMVRGQSNPKIPVVEDVIPSRGAAAKLPAEHCAITGANIRALRQRKRLDRGPARKLMGWTANATVCAA